MLHQLQEKAGRISDLSVTLDNVRAEVTTLTQQLEGEATLKQELQAELSNVGTILPAKSDSDIMFCLQSYHGLIIDRPLVY